MQINRTRVRTVLLWLKEHNKFFKDIEIDNETLSEFRDNMDATDHLPSVDIDLPESDDQSDLLETFVPNPNVVDQTDQILAEFSVEHPYIDPEPINEFTTDGYVACAFWWLFPTGDEDFHDPRDQDVTLREWVEYLMFYYDGRFRNDHLFGFFAFNTTYHHLAIKQATFYTNNSTIKNMSLEELKEKLSNGDESILKQIAAHNANIRGSRCYWCQRTSEL